MTDNLYQQEAEFALEAVREGARLARQIRKDFGQVHIQKRDRSPVTLADYGVQALVSGRLEESFPEDPLVAEEDVRSLKDDLDSPRLKEYLDSYLPKVTDQQIIDWIGRGGGKAGPAGRFWTLDPVDGTKGYIRGGQYVVALALIDRGKVVLGALGCPELGEGGSVAFAVRGRGAWREPLEGRERTKLSVSQIRSPSDARLIQSVEPGHTNLEFMQHIQSDLAIEADPLLMDSQAKYLMLASGEADMMVRPTPPADPDYRTMIWDVAAGSLLVQEAGGRVTDLEGRDLDFTAGNRLTNNRGQLISNGYLHEAGLRAVFKEQA